MYLPIKIMSEKQASIEIIKEAFLDSGATGKFINQNFANKSGLKLEKIEKPISVYNMDGTPNKKGMIKYYLELNIEIHEQTRKEQLMVTGLGKKRLFWDFLGLNEQSQSSTGTKGLLNGKQPKGPKLDRSNWNQKNKLEQL